MRSKIKDLFDYRKLPELLAYQNDKEQDTFLSKLYSLQEKIYYLDKYLESSWSIQTEELEEYWKSIGLCLEDLNIHPKNHAEYLSLIHRYQNHELLLRQKTAFSNISLDYYYYYKSCDVKLLRRLIYEYNPALEKAFDLSEWTCFDLITEINDDIDDIEEDKEVINGNGFILNAYLNGLEDTCITFNHYIKETINRHCRKSSIGIDKEWGTKIHELNVQYAEDTLVLLEKKKTKLTKDPSYIDQNMIVLKFEEKQN